MESGLQGGNHKCGGLTEAGTVAQRENTVTWRAAGIFPISELRGWRCGAAAYGATCKIHESRPFQFLHSRSRLGLQGSLRGLYSI